MGFSALDRSHVVRVGYVVAGSLALLGCRDDIVLRLSLEGKTEQIVEGSFSGRTGVDYQFWADYSYEPDLETKQPRFCYDVEVEVVQEGAVVSTARCYSVPNKGTCMSTSGNGAGDCKTNCAFKLDKAGQTTLRAKLTKGEPCDTAYAGLSDPNREMHSYKLLLEEDD